jgi:peptidoglycan/LPS O-acetylase OafA/YrhL
MKSMQIPLRETSSPIPNEYDKNANAFDLLRLILSIFVVITHGYLIGGYGANDPLEKIMNFKSPFSLGTIGVMGFFSLSGYLITASFERYHNPLVFVYHRLFRILPGFWVCLIVTALFLAPATYTFHNHTLFGFSWKDSLSYIQSNFFVTIKQWSIGSTLERAAYKESINGSLWSLFPELICYTFTFIAGILGVFRSNKIILLVFCFWFFSLYVMKNHGFNHGPTFIMLNDLGRMQIYTSYICGCLLYVYSDSIIIDTRGVLFLLIVSILCLRFGGFSSISPLLISVIIIRGFSSFTLKIRHDLSYGIYIYSFPLQQLLYGCFGSSLPVAIYVSFSIIGSCIFAFLSFILVEKPFISMRKRIDKLVLFSS